MDTQLTPQEQAVRRELEETLAEINAQIEAELAKLLPLLGDKTTEILAMELEVNPAHIKHLHPSGYSEASPAEATRVQ